MSTPPPAARALPASALQAGTVAMAPAPAGAASLAGAPAPSAPVSAGAPLHQQAYEHLWVALIEGELPAGTRLKDADWAQRLGVSRTPVREAFRKLVQDGALDPLGTVGFAVHAFTATDLAGLYACRAALEAVAAAEAAEAADAALLGALSANLAAAQAALDAGDLDALQRLNGEFHQALLAASGNLYLRRLLEQTGRLVRMARWQVLRHAAADAARREDYRRSLQPVIDDHRALYEALTRGDGATAAALMQRHLLATARDMTALLDAEAVA